MLPSFRLIAATFLCGFVVVYAGLRVASSLNDIHEALPVMAARAAPAPIEAAASPDVRRGQSAVPVMYDLRFVASSASLAPTLTRLMSPPERIAPAQPPLAIIPPGIEDRPAPAVIETKPAKPGETLAAIQPVNTPTARPEPAAAAPIEPPKPEALKPETPAVAAIDPQPAVSEPAPAANFDIPLPEPAEVDLSPSATDAARTKAAATAKTTALEPAAARTPIPAPDAPAVDLVAPSAIVISPPIPKAKPALRVRAKAAPRKRIRTARRAEPKNAFDNQFGSFGNSNLKYSQSPFGTPK